MWFRRKKDIEKHAKKVDKLVTGLIIGGAVASMIGLAQKETRDSAQHLVGKQGTKVVKKGYSLFGKCLVKIISTITKK